MSMVENTNLRGPMSPKGVDVKDTSQLEPGAKDSLFDKNVAGKEYVNSGGVAHSDLGGENKRK